MLAYVIEMAAPGLKTSDFKVSINGKILTISCLHKEGECEKKVYRQQEFNFRCFKKEIVMPENVNSCLVNTGYVGGILYATLPKSKKTFIHCSERIVVY